MAKAAGAAAAAVASLGLALGDNGLCVKLPAEAMEASPPGLISEEPEPGVVDAGGVATVTVIPADSRWGRREKGVRQ